MLLQLLDVVVDEPAMGAFVVAIFDEGNERIGWTLDMVPLTNVND
jgi:hypothetical protein